MNQVLVDYSWISGLLMGITSIIAAVGGILLGYKDYNKRKTAEAKEKSVGAEALKKVESKLDDLEQKTDNLTDQMRELKNDVRQNATEYLSTLRQLAERTNNHR